MDDTHVALGLGTPTHTLAGNCHSYLQHQGIPISPGTGAEHATHAPNAHREAEASCSLLPTAGGAGADLPLLLLLLLLLLLGMISWPRRVRLKNPLGHGNFVSGLKLSGGRDGGLGLAQFSAVCPYLK
jgi:hypothetical protein